MGKYEVRIAEEALRDMTEIYRYIAVDLLAPENAIRQYNRLADAILSLELFPERYTLFETEPEHSHGMRKMVVDNYLICYIVDSEIVTVTDVLFGASNIHTRLLERHP